MKCTDKSGFTLVEIAIVLVIIGLLIGGVLAGESLIKTAGIRSATAQIEKYTSASATFRTKYNAYAGDLKSPHAASAGFQARAGTDGLGDGDGLLENGASGAGVDKQGIGGEAALFWRDLTSAGLIADGFNTAPGTVATALADDAAVATILPTLKLREAADVHATSISGINYFYIAAISTVDVTTGFPSAETAALSPFEAEHTDSKVDDGDPNTGVIRIYDNLTDAVASTPATPGAALCVSNTAGNPYNLSNSADALTCRIRWRTGF